MVVNDEGEVIRRTASTENDIPDSSPGPEIEEPSPAAVRGRLGPHRGTETGGEIVVAGAGKREEVARAVERGGGGELIVAGKGEPSRAGLGERSAGTGKRRGEGDVLGAGVDEEGLDRSRAEPGGIIRGVGRRVLERATAEADRAGRANRPGAPQREDAADEGRAAGVGVISSEREGAGADLRERATGTDQRPVVGDVLTVGVDPVRLIGRRGETGRVVGDVASRMPERAAAEADRAGGAEGSRTPQGEHAAVDGRAAGVGIGAGEGDCAGRGTGLRQNACAAEDG